jgi:hypothetical protein
MRSSKFADGIPDDQEDYTDPPPSFPKHHTADNPQTSGGAHSKLTQRRSETCWVSEGPDDFQHD